ncbi:MAG TPA: transporter, partial [Rhizomicrobium sp.]
MAATPQTPGWALASIYYHTSVAASGAVGLSREISIGKFNPTINVNINANVSGTGDLGILAPSYVFATPFLGGQASATLVGIYGRNDTALNATATVTPGPLTKSVALEQNAIAFGDMIPQFAVRWNAGVNNYMTYLTGDIPVGKYDSTDLANLGLGHGAIDGGAGYTYFDPKAGNEFSATFGLTGNFKNQSTGYTNGIDSHLDVGLSKFVSKQLQIGLVGYYFQQLTADSGCAPILCPFKSRVAGLGPQIGYLFPVGGMQGYLNLKGYKEFDAEDRPQGWNAWVTFVLSPAAPAA